MTSKEDARVRALLQTASRPEIVVPVVLNAGVASEIDELENELVELRHEKLDTLAGDPRAKEIADQIDALIEEAKESTIRVKLRGLRRKHWTDLLAKYPPDDPLKFRYDPKIWNEAIPACWVEPEIDDDTRDKLLDELTGGQWDRLIAATQHVNGDVDVPFSALASRIHRASDASEQQQEPTA